MNSLHTSINMTERARLAFNFIRSTTVRALLLKNILRSSSTHGEFIPMFHHIHAYIRACIRIGMRVLVTPGAGI